MPKYDDYDFDDLSLNEQFKFLNESKVATDEMRKKYEARRDQFVRLLEKRSASLADGTKWLLYQNELIKLDPFNPDLLVQRAEFSARLLRAHLSSGANVRRVNKSEYEFYSAPREDYSAALMLDPTRVELRIEMKHLYDAIAEGEDCKSFINGGRSIDNLDVKHQNLYYSQGGVLGLIVGNYKFVMEETFEKMSQPTNEAYWIYAIACSQSNPSKLSSDILIHADAWFDKRVSYAHGLFHSQRNEVEVAVDDFENAIELSGGHWAQPRIALREERVKLKAKLKRDAAERQLKETQLAEVRRVQEIKLAEERKKNAELKATVAAEIQKKHDEKVKKANELYGQALLAYQNKDFEGAADIAARARALNVLPSQQNKILYACLVIIAINKESLPRILVMMNGKKHDKEIQQLQTELECQEKETKEKLTAHQKWLKTLSPIVCDAAIKGAIDGYEVAAELKLTPLRTVLRNAEMAKEKRPLLLKLLETEITNANVFTNTFSKYDKDILIYKLAQALQAFFSAKPAPCLGSAPPAVHFSVKQSNIASASSDIKLVGAIRNAIHEKKTTKTPEADNVVILRKRLSVIDREKIAPQLKAIHENYLLPAIKEVVAADGKDEKATPPADAKHSPVAAAAPIPATQTAVAGTGGPSVETGSSVYDDKSVPHKGLTMFGVSARPVQPASQTAQLPPASPAALPASTVAVAPVSVAPPTITPHQALATKLALLKQKPRSTAADLKAIHGGFTDLEAKAMELKSADFYKARADFYFESAQATVSSIRKSVFYVNALQDYRQVLIYDPFAEGVPERMESIEKQNRENTQKSQLFAAAPAKREELSAEDTAKLEAIKARLRQQQMTAPPTNTMG